MRPPRPWLVLALAVVGVFACLLGVSGFIWAVFTNNLPWEPQQSARDYYLDVGNAFGDGFIMGFFLCFFLVLGALTTWSLLGFQRTNPTTQVQAPREAPRLRVIRGRKS